MNIYIYIKSDCVYNLPLISKVTLTHLAQNEWIIVSTIIKRNSGYCKHNHISEKIYPERRNYQNIKRSARLELFSSAVREPATPRHNGGAIDRLRPSVPYCRDIRGVLGLNLPLWCREGLLFSVVVRPIVVELTNDRSFISVWLDPIPTIDIYIYICSDDWFSLLHKEKNLFEL